MGVVQTKETLAKVVADILQLPYNQRQSKAYYIVKAIQQVLTEALLRGETIKIDGFGIFSIRTRKPTRHGCFYPHGQKGKHVLFEVKDFPAKTYVYFKPAKPLLRMINETQS